MKNIETLLTEIGIEIPDDKKEAFNKSFHENYKTTVEFSKLQTKADAYKEQAETASETLKNFEGLEPDKIKAEVESWKKKAEDAEKDYNAKLLARDYDEALSKAMDGYKFTSNSAKKSILSQIKSANLPMKDGKIFGLSEYIETIKAEDDGAFVKEEDERKPRFTVKNDSQNSKLTKEQILAIKDAGERQTAIAQNIELFS